MVQEDERVREETIEECFENTKVPPIKVKWIDHNKEDRDNVNVRTRLVAK